MKATAPRAPWRLTQGFLLWPLIGPEHRPPRAREDSIGSIGSICGIADAVDPTVGRDRLPQNRDGFPQPDTPTHGPRSVSPTASCSRCYLCNRLLAFLRNTVASLGMQLPASTGLGKDCIIWPIQSGDCVSFLFAPLMDCLMKG